MATRAQQPDRPNFTRREYERLQTVLEAAFDRGDTTFLTAELADRADLSDAQVYEALSHLSRKYEYITDSGAGTWTITGREG